jgi:hypothetical protein
MIDNFGLAVSHGLIIIALWRLLRRPDLDDVGTAPAAEDGKGWSRREDRPGA